jgi:excisionase family DNA binding protein
MIDSKDSQKPQTSEGEQSSEPSGGGAIAQQSWFNVKWASQYANVSIDTIYTACENGTLRSTKVGRVLRLRPEWIDSFLERQARGGADEKDRR